jgi:hypothetical protein
MPNTQYIHIKKIKLNEIKSLRSSTSKESSQDKKLKRLLI